MKNTMTNTIKNKMTNTKKTEKHGFKTRIIAGVLSIITAFSVCATALTSASAAETGKVESVKHKSATLLF